MKKLLSIALCAVMLSCALLTGPASARGERSLYLGGCGQADKAYWELVKAYPDVTVRTSSNIYLSTNEIINAFVCGEFPFDTFRMNSSSFDFRKMIEKGYCGKLTESAFLRGEAERMLPSVQRLILRDGELYGVPSLCNIQYYMYNPDAWEAAGLSEADVPASFEEYLDFLEAWAERIRVNPEYEISVCNAFDSEQYGAHSYILHLVDLLLSNYIMQCNYAGEPLRFDTPTFRTLLTRCQEIGAALYAYEPEEKGDLALFDVRNGMRELAHMVPLRLTAEQPVLIKATLYCAFLNVRSGEKEIATQYLENCLTYLDADAGAYLYSDAQPIEDKQFLQLLTGLENAIRSLEKRLSDESLTPLEQTALRDKLEEKQTLWAQMSESENRYLISEKDLENYRRYGDCLYFQAPSVFDPATEEGVNVRRLRDRFCMGELPAEQLITELNNLAWMLEMEGA